MCEGLSTQEKLIVQETIFNEAERLRQVQRQNRLPADASDAIDRQVRLLVTLAQRFSDQGPV